MRKPERMEINNRIKELERAQSELKQAENELLLLKAYYEELFNSSPEAIVLHDNNDIVVNINKEFTRLFGYSSKEAIGKKINELVANEFLIEEASSLSKKVINGEKVEFDSRRKCKNGSLVDVTILGAPVFYRQKQIGVYAIYRDITERRKAEEVRIKAKEEAKTARHIQINLLPKSNPVIPDYDIAGKNIPACDVGGDYYDFIPLDKHRLAICLGDVSGKGLPASLVMANLQATIRGQAFFNSTANECLDISNKLLFHSTDNKTFISLFYGILDTREKTFCYGNAGQNMPFIISAGNQVSVLNTRGLVLAVNENVVYEKEVILIHPEDKLLIYSDGITEAMNSRHEEFGEERLKEIFTKNINLSAEDLTEKIISSVKLHSGNNGQNDDMTLIVLKRIR